MAIIPKLKGIVLNGNIVLDYNDKIKQQKWLQSLNGKRIEMIIRPFRAKRTIPQNAYYWGVVLKTISKETGYTSEELHEFFKRIFLKKEIVIGGKVYETSISTRKLKKDQFSEYIEKIKGFVFLRLDLVIPEAGEYEPDGFIVDEDIDEIKIEDMPFL
ncbi:MAG TPA: hypothetical protein PL092_03160, partial [Candidatus Pacearchaeota archaeon]|nr:hypothetical protein [Candidatus Pacearchaeota archaeon]